MSLKAWSRAALVLSAVTFAVALPGAALAAKPTSSSCRRSCTTTSDTTAPSVSISSPTSGATVSGTISVTGSAADNVSLARVDISVDGGAWTLAGGAASWSAPLDTTSYSNGSHTVAARATDSSGNTSMTSVGVNVSNAAPDTTAPSVAISSPAAGSTVRGTVSVTGSASDNAGVARVDLAVDGGGWSTVSGTTSWTMSWNTASLADGAHSISARSVDTSGNVSSSVSVSVTVSNGTTSGGTSTAPDTQGTWVSPEGATISVNSAGPWTIRQIYNMLLANSSAPGDFSRIAPDLTIDVQDTYSSSTQSVAQQTNGVYTNFSATVWLQGVNSTFAATPDAVLGHEYGHAWTNYHLYIDRQGDWNSYLNFRWSALDGSTVLAQDSRLDSTHSWKRTEIIADDYRLLFGSSAAIQQSPSHLNTTIADPRNVTGLRNWLLTNWA